MGRQYGMNVAVIVGGPLALQSLGVTVGEADSAIRSARRQVQRYGDEARHGLLSWCRNEHERELVARALDPGVRVGTVVNEWEARRRIDLSEMTARELIETLGALSRSRS